MNRGILVSVLVAGLGAHVYGAALTAERNTPSRAGESLVLGVCTNTRIFAGGMVAVNPAGYATNAAAVSGYKVVGCAIETVDNRTNAENAGTNGALSVAVRRGVFGWANGGSVKDADIGSLAYVIDNQTVTVTGAVNAVVAGIVVDVDASYVWVDAGNFNAAASAPPTLAVSGNGTIGGTLGVTGAATFSTNATVSGALAVSAGTTLSGSLTLSQVQAAGAAQTYFATNAPSLVSSNAPVWIKVTYDGEVYVVRADQLDD